MQIDVIASVAEARSDDLVGRTVMVIDVLRATSNMATGLAHGCLGIVPVETVQQAKGLQEPGDLLGGERNCKKLAGFDLGNSPLEYMDDTVLSKRILMTTTNGTRAMQKAQKAQTLLACSLLNAKACAAYAAGLRKDIILLCSGTQDEFSLEDGLCAGLVLDELMQQFTGEIGASDFALAMHACYLKLQANLTDALLNCSNGKRLAKIGYQDDILYCAQVNKLNIVPIMKDGMVVQLVPSAK